MPQLDEEAGIDKKGVNAPVTVTLGPFGKPSRMVAFFAHGTAGSGRSR
jgi:hypothetical protein